MKDNKQKIQLSPTEVAYMYQQIAEFEPFCLPDSEVDIEVKRSQRNLHNNEFAVAFTLSGGGAYVKSMGRSSSLYEAAKEAKCNLLAHLTSIQDKMMREEEYQSDESNFDLATQKYKIH